MVFEIVFANTNDVAAKVEHRENVFILLSGHTELYSVSGVVT